MKCYEERGIEIFSRVKELVTLYEKECPAVIEQALSPRNSESGSGSIHTSFTGNHMAGALFGVGYLALFGL